MFTQTEYETLNKSFKTRFVFNLGVNEGFFSEYNNMILAMLYCLENKICFSFYSKTANFGIKDGWKDYFLPFCEEDSNTNHSRFNYRMPYIRNTKTDNKFYNYCFNKYVNPFKNSFDPFRERMRKLLYFRNSKPIDYFTYSLWDEFRSNKMMSKRFIIPELGIEGDLQEACSLLINYTWKYNSLASEKVDALIQSVNLPKEYIGIHIRRGDKKIEYNLFGIDEYIKKAESHSNLRNAFILTDDYGVITQLKSRFTNWQFFTLCRQDETGYVNKEFKLKDVEFRYQNLIKLFASMDILYKSNLFVGTFSSNPGMYLGMRRPKDSCEGIDLPWCIW